MKIGIVCYPTFGGSGVLATELGMGLARKGHQIHFITHRRPARLAVFQENVLFHEVAPFDYPLFEYSPYETALASKLVDVVKYENLDLLHVHYAVPHATVGFLAKKILMSRDRYIPVVTTLHGTDITLVGMDSSYAPVVEFSINNSDGVTAVSRYLRDTTLNHFNIAVDIEVIYNFINFDRFNRVNKDHFRKAIAPEGEKILVHVSNFRKVKRVEDVIRIFHQVHKEIPSKLLLVGDGPERQGLEDLCRKLEIGGETRFLGKQDAIEEILAIADLFLIPSGNESFGLAALEAMACEVPVISSNVGGLPEVNIEGKTGFLSDIGNVDEMAANSIKLLSNEKMLKKFRANAFQRAKQFDIQKILPQYEKYYESILKGAAVR
jgi:N-acetyl-alpha-D-glucosaminyl L-malate synthase BshA